MADNFNIIIAEVRKSLSDLRDNKTLVLTKDMELIVSSTVTDLQWPRDKELIKTIRRVFEDLSERASEISADMEALLGDIEGAFCTTARSMAELRRDEESAQLKLSQMIDLVELRIKAVKILEEFYDFDELTMDLF